jgi:hypothetical protein
MRRLHTCHEGKAVNLSVTHKSELSNQSQRQQTQTPKMKNGKTLGNSTINNQILTHELTKKRGYVHVVTLADNRTTKSTSTSIKIEYLPKTHPRYNPNAHDSAGSIIILTIDDVSRFKISDGEWRITHASHPFFDIRDIQTDRGVVIGTFGDILYRHRRVEMF